MAIGSWSEERHLEIIDENTIVINPHQIWYLSSFITKQIKMRIVYDAKAKYRGISLNDCLYPGADCLNKLLDILLRFRENEFAFSCDIKNMFMQVGIAEKNRDLLRLLWFENHDINGKMIQCRFRVLPYGLGSSVCMSQKSLGATAEENSVNEDEDTVQMAKDDIYMDDGLGSFSAEETATRVALQLIDLLASGGFELRKFISNSKPLLDAVGEDKWSSGLSGVDLTKGEIPEHKILGVMWDPETDMLKIRIAPTSHAMTKRGLWSAIMQIYDPL